MQTVDPTTIKKQTNILSPVPKSCSPVCFKSMRWKFSATFRYSRSKQTQSQWEVRVLLGQWIYWLWCTYNRKVCDFQRMGLRLSWECEKYFAYVFFVKMNDIHFVLLVQRRSSPRQSAVFLDMLQRHVTDEWLRGPRVMDVIVLKRQSHMFELQPASMFLFSKKLC